MNRILSCNDVCSSIMNASRGITTCAVHATVELRLTLISFLDDLTQVQPSVTIIIYVDDTSFEASGTDKTIKK